MRIDEIVTQELARFRKLGGGPEDSDLKQAAYTRIFFDESLPPQFADWLRQVSRRAIGTEIKRATRRSIRKPSLEGLGILAATRAVDIGLKSVGEEIAAIATNDFERDMVRVLSGVHDRFGSFSEFARAEQFCSQADAYRRRTRFRRRAVKQFQQLGIRRPC
jgi:hypothetical protein